MSEPIDYRGTASSIVSAPTPPAVAKQRAVSSPLDFDVTPAEGEDAYQPGFYSPGAFVSHLRSDRPAEAGIYNVLLYTPEPDSPAWFRAPKFLLSTNNYHPQSAPVRPSYLIHAYRLLLAVEQLLGGEKRVFAVYDCGEDSGVDIGHKCVRFYITRSDIEPRIPSKSIPLPKALSLDTPAEELADVFEEILRDHVPQSPPYNLYVTRDQAIIVERKAGTHGNIEEFGPGLWDGARLLKQWD